LDSGEGVDSDKVTVDSTDSVKVDVSNNKVTADAMLVNAEKGDLLFSDGGMSQDEDLIGNRNEVECLKTRFLESNNVEPHITHV